MALLPEEFSRTQEESGAHLPAYHIRPLVNQDRKIAIRTYPVLVGVPDNSFRRRPYNQLFLQLGGRVHYHARTVRIGHQTVMGDYRTFLCETFHVLGLTAKERLRDEKREIGILVPGFLEHLVQLMLHLLPYSIAIRFYYHTSSDCRILSQTSFNNKVVIPLGVILLS